MGLDELHVLEQPDGTKKNLTFLEKQITYID